ncbi:hypothetical protein [Galbibacter pacificus]|uniref:Uncharacterized protein n=1 Tax=Galbibacter pacificus TaxID=2996052 RepID=A0ABT6FQ76_9FLAO|nr:hypothetical protein [Galbibacter pacificus]MDG3582107.1 hypothetical protein [Galbibacter pacificus]MDG3585417.1 hypothetical protein [Galbibacter pacificus]
MKSLILSTVLILATSFAFAQNKDVLEETVTKTTTVKDNKGEEQSQQSVVVRKEQNINLSEADRNKINQERVASPVKITKHETIIDGNVQTVLDNNASFTCEGVECDFSPSNQGFIIGGNDNTLKATSYKSSSNDFIVETEKGNGIGYFDSNANFVIEYYDKDQNKIVKRVYTAQQQ